MNRPSRPARQSWVAVGLLGLLACFAVAPALAQEVVGDADYRSVGDLDSRMIMWVVAELHLMFGAFVLGVPIDHRRDHRSPDRRQTL